LAACRREPGRSTIGVGGTGANRNRVGPRSQREMAGILAGDASVAAAARPTETGRGRTARTSADALNRPPASKIRRDQGRCAGRVENRLVGRDGVGDDDDARATCCVSRPTSTSTSVEPSSYNNAAASPASAARTRRGAVEVCVHTAPAPPAPALSCYRATAARSEGPCSCCGRSSCS
jgi:hypothetical protein